MKKVVPNVSPVDTLSVEVKFKLVLDNAFFRNDTCFSLEEFKDHSRAVSAVSPNQKHFLKWNFYWVWLRRLLQKDCLANIRFSTFLLQLLHGYLYQKGRQGGDEYV